MIHKSQEDCSTLLRTDSYRINQKKTAAMFWKTLRREKTGASK